MLSANYGIYGPAFERYVSQAREAGSEEYRDSEKYQAQEWPQADDDLSAMIAIINRVRHEHPALQTDRGLAFHRTDNPLLICYSKRTDDASDIVLVIVNLDPFSMQHGWIQLPLEDWRTGRSETIEAHDVLTDETYYWRGAWNYVRLDPGGACRAAWNQGCWSEVWLITSSVTTRMPRSWASRTNWRNCLRVP